MIVVNHQLHGYAIAGKAGCGYNHGRDQVVSYTHNGMLYGGVIYSDYTRRTISAHIAGFRRNWLTRGFIIAMFDYPFRQLGVESVLIRIRSDNRRTLDFAIKLGFNLETILFNVFPNANLVIMRMYRKDCRFLIPEGLVDGQQERSATAA